MKRFRIVAVLLIMINVFSFSACGKVEEKASEKAAEKMAENATGANVDLNADGKDGVKIEKDGVSLEGGENLKWPKEKMGDIPAPKAKITAVMKDDNNGGATVVFNEMTKEDANNYSQMLKGMGFKGGMTLTDEDMIMVSGKNEKGETVNFTYTISPKEGSVTYSPKK